MQVRLLLASWGLGCLWLQGCANGAGGASGDGSGARASDGSSDSSGSASTTAGQTPGDDLTDGETGELTAASDPISTDTGVDHEIAVRVGGMEVQSGESVALEGSTDVLTLGAPVTVEITNVGDRDLELGSVSLSGDSAHFSVDDADLEPVLGPQESSAVVLTFSPVNGGVKAATLTIASNDASEADFVVGVTAQTTPNTYRQLRPQVAPVARAEPAMASLSDGRVLMFGGRRADGSDLNDTWVYDVEANAWAELSPSPIPSPRVGATLVGLGNGDGYLFGGYVPGIADLPGSRTAALWRFNAGSNDWEPAASGPDDVGLSEHAATRLSSTEMIVWGGRTDVGITDETLVYDADKDTWRRIVADAAPPAGTRAVLGLLDATTVLKFGGRDREGNLLRDLFTYDSGMSTWGPVAADLGVFARVDAVAAVYDRGFVVFSGREDSYSYPMSGTFHYESSTGAWADISPSSEPTPRNYAGIAYVGRNKAVMFGGLTSTANASALAETWEYVGP